MSILILGRLPNTVKACLVTLMIAMAEVEPSNIHSSIDELLDGGNVPTGWTHGADDFRLALADITGSLDTSKGDIRSAELRTGGCCLRLHVGELLGGSN
jgi:hypothetical protein